MRKHVLAGMVVLLLALLSFVPLMPVHAQGGNDVGITVFVFRDANGNGGWDTGEVGVTGATVRIARVGVSAVTRATDGSGYVFYTGPTGLYMVQLVGYPAGYTPSTGQYATLPMWTPRSTRTVYFGLKPASSTPTPTPAPPSGNFDLASTASVCIRSWNDGVAVLHYEHTVRNLGPDAARGVPVHLDERFTVSGATDVTWVSDRTISLAAGQTWRYGRDVTVRGAPGSPWLFGGQALAATRANLRWGRPVIPEGNTGNNTANTGWIYPSWCTGAAPRIYGYAFLDGNRNGRRDPGEPRANVTVQLWQGGRWVGNASPAWGSGYFAFDIPVGRLRAGRNFALRAIAPGATFTTRDRYFVTVSRTSRYGPYLFGVTTASPPTPTPTPTVRPTPTPTPTPPPECWPPKEWVVETPPQAGLSYSPRFPVVVGQGGSGFDVQLSARGGYAELRRKEPRQRTLPGGGWEWICVERMVRREAHPLVSVEVRGALSADSRRWIEEQLAARYYGATVRDPGVGGVVFRGVRMDWSGGFHHDAVDPGVYAGEVVFRFRGSSLSPGDKVLVRPFAVPVYMVDTTLER